MINKKSYLRFAVLNNNTAINMYMPLCGIVGLFDRLLITQGSAVLEDINLYSRTFATNQDMHKLNRTQTLYGAIFGDGQALRGGGILFDVADAQTHVYNSANIQTFANDYAIPLMSSIIGHNDDGMQAVPLSWLNDDIILSLRLSSIADAFMYSGVPLTTLDSDISAQVSVINVEFIMDCSVVTPEQDMAMFKDFGGLEIVQTRLVYKNVQAGDRFARSVLPNLKSLRSLFITHYHTSEFNTRMSNCTDRRVNTMLSYQLNIDGELFPNIPQQVGTTMYMSAAYAELLKAWHNDIEYDAQIDFNSWFHNDNSCLFGIKTNGHDNSFGSGVSTGNNAQLDITYRLANAAILSLICKYDAVLSLKDGQLSVTF